MFKRNKTKNNEKYGIWAKFENKKEVVSFANSKTKLKHDTELKYSNIKSVELIVDDNVVTKFLSLKNSRYYYKVEIKIIDMQNTIYRITFVAGKTKADSMSSDIMMDNAEKIFEKLEQIALYNQT